MMAAEIIARLPTLGERIQAINGLLDRLVVLEAELEQSRQDCARIASEAACNMIRAVKSEKERDRALQVATEFRDATHRLEDERDAIQLELDIRKAAAATASRLQHEVNDLKAALAKAKEQPA